MQIDKEVEEYIARFPARVPEDWLLSRDDTTGGAIAVTRGENGELVAHLIEHGSLNERLVKHLEACGVRDITDADYAHVPSVAVDPTGDH